MTHRLHGPGRSSTAAALAARRGQSSLDENAWVRSCCGFASTSRGLPRPRRRRQSGRRRFRAVLVLAGEYGAAMADLEITTTGGVLRLTMNRPEQRNALTGEMAAGIAHELEQAATDEAVRVVLITGAGGGFSSGADVAGLLGDADFEDVMARAARMIRAVVALDRPVVASVPGPAAGVAAGLALVCDLVVAAESASFLLPFTRIGLMPDGGTTASAAAADRKSVV